MGISVLSPSSYGPTQNLLHNGAMQVAQRGTSVTGITSPTAYSGGTWPNTAGYFTADRWNFIVTTLGTWTNSVESDAPTGSGFQKSLKILCTTADASPAAGDYVTLRQKIEGQNLQMLKKGTASAEQVTLSFWTKSDKTGTYIVVLYDDDNARSVSAAYTVASSGTWERQSVTFPGDTTGAFVNDSGPSLSVEWWLAAGSSFTTGTLATTWGAAAGNRAVGQTNLAAATNYWQITGAQLEVGATASKFQFRPYDQDLSDCQRYYQIIPVGTYAATGTCYDSSASIIYSFPFAVQMRASGTLATAITTSGLKTTNSSGVSTNTNAIIATYCTPTQCTPIATVTGSSYGDARVGYVATAINVTADL